ncbi:uncharacterized protein LOC110457310 [Mizuhopecten yessoensis]|uniref:Uncharacterized protein n=1 Tax=Mizuhopecten yessoensis TaxID=6573 RepID=A0A210R3S4_MIZYE|nr:uncharacterized protein LOC110457310 [Mizuhopecten yessoensis]OWF55639.1 hypothetical protein KP79_PYT20985 [Mizuhopecten yessoensis]
MKIFPLVCLVAAFSLVKTEYKCICNANHPNVPIRKCPSIQSPVNGFLYLKEANNHFHGIVDTSPATCRPIRTDVKTIPEWVAVDEGNQVGFIFKDVGLLAISCPGNHTLRKDVTIPTDCSEAVHIIPQGSEHFAPITNAPTAPAGISTTLSRLATLNMHTTPSTTIVPTTSTMKPLSHLPTCRDDIIFSLALNESVEHYGAKRCPDGLPVSAEAVVMEYCGIPVMSQWKQGIKVIDNCDLIPRFTPVAVYISGLLMGRSAVFHSCQNGGIELIQQRCGSPIALHLEHRLAAFYYVLTWT